MEVSDLGNGKLAMPFTNIPKMGKEWIWEEIRLLSILVFVEVYNVYLP